MPSPAERVRRVAELVLRATALAALAVLLWRALRPPTAAGVSVAAGDLTRALERWTLAGPAELRVVLDKAPDARTRDWIRALGSPARARCECDPQQPPEQRERAQSAPELEQATT